VPSYQQSIFIRRVISEVYAYMGDISREHEWQPQLLEAEQTPPGATIVGSRRRYVTSFMGKRIENTYVVEAIEENRRLVCQTTRESAVSAATLLTWEEEGDGTRVTMAVEGTAGGLLRFVPDRVLASAFESEVNGALDRLKERLESGV
jgi:hypothetical protein